jgi:hypothetical protein
VTFTAQTTDLFPAFSVALGGDLTINSSSPAGPGGAYPRSLQYHYSKGFLTSIPGYLTSLSYFDNLTPSQIVHSNGVVETYTRDPNWMPRFGGVGTNAGWTTGPYGYDGAGNITAIGSARFRYDAVSRLVAAQIPSGLNGNGVADLQSSFSYDVFGSLTNIQTATSGNRAVPLSGNTNRLSSTIASYDKAGNATAISGSQFRFDDFNQAWEWINGDERWW